MISWRWGSHAVLGRSSGGQPLVERVLPVGALPGLLAKPPNILAQLEGIVLFIQPLSCPQPVGKVLLRFTDLTPRWCVWGRERSRRRRTGPRR